MLAADCAFIALPLIDLTACIRIKGTDTQMMNVAVKDIGKNTAFLLYIAVFPEADMARMQ